MYPTIKKLFQIIWIALAASLFSFQQAYADSETGSISSIITGDSTQRPDYVECTDPRPPEKQNCTRNYIPVCVTLPVMIGKHRCVSTPDKPCPMTQETAPHPCDICSNPINQGYFPGECPNGN